MITATSIRFALAVGAYAATMICIAMAIAGGGA